MTRFLFPFLVLFFGLNACAAHSPRETGTEPLTFSLYRPLARNVQFLSSLDGYQSHEAHRGLWGVWEIHIPADRHFSYFYEVDGSPIIPDCQFKEFDDFGSQVCLYLP